MIKGILAIIGLIVVIRWWSRLMMARGAKGALRDINARFEAALDQEDDTQR